MEAQFARDGKIFLKTASAPGPIKMGGSAKKVQSVRRREERLTLRLPKKKKREEKSLQRNRYSGRKVFAEEEPKPRGTKTTGRRAQK